MQARGGTDKIGRWIDAIARWSAGRVPPLRHSRPCSHAPLGGVGASASGLPGVSVRASPLLTLDVPEARRKRVEVQDVVCTPGRRLSSIRADNTLPEHYPTTFESS